MISDNGDFITIIRLSKEDFKFLPLRIVAVDGSFHEVYISGRKLSYIVISSVISRLDGKRFTIESIDVKDELYEYESPEEEMRKMEYDVANSLDYDIIFLDRLLSLDEEKGMKIPKNSIGIVKDFDYTVRNKLNNLENPPWLVVKDDKTGYFKLLQHSWVFLVNKAIKMDWEDLLKLLTIFGNEPIPEALGYNYLLYLADKASKYYRDVMASTLDLFQFHDLARYRDFRSFIERIRRHA